MRGGFQVQVVEVEYVPHGCPPGRGWQRRGQASQRVLARGERDGHRVKQ